MHHEQPKSTSVEYLPWEYNVYNIMMSVCILSVCYEFVYYTLFYCIVCAHMIVDCLMNYHDECKDKVLICQKQKTRERKVRNILYRFLLYLGIIDL